jgi:hypothetical protein
MADELDPRITLLEKAWATPAARPLMEKAFKQAFPNAEIPGLALREAAESVEKKLTEKEQELDAKLQRFEAKRAHDEIVSDLKKQKYTDDDIKAIEKIMTDEGVGLHVNAATIYDARRQVAAPRTPQTEPRGSMSPRAYGRGAHAAFFNGIMEGEFHHPGEEWARDKVDMILQDFQTDRAAAEAKWNDPSYWPASPNFPVKV